MRYLFGFWLAVTTFVLSPCMSCKHETQPVSASQPPTYAYAAPQYGPAQENPSFAPAPAGTAANPSAPAVAPFDPFERVRARCIELTNAYRAQVGAPPVGRVVASERCADQQAAADGQSRSAHGAFGRCGEGAQNECPAWNGAADDVIERCLAMMFAEGPGAGPAHGHYTNMTERAYRGAACGVATMPNGDVWIVQNFYR